MLFSIAALLFIGGIVMLRILPIKATTVTSDNRQRMAIPHIANHGGTKRPTNAASSGGACGNHHAFPQRHSSQHPLIMRAEDNINKQPAVKAHDHLHHQHPQTRQSKKTAGRNSARLATKPTTKQTANPQRKIPTD